MSAWLHLCSYHTVTHLELRLPGHISPSCSFIHPPSSIHSSPNPIPILHRWCGILSSLFFFHIYPSFTMSSCRLTHCSCRNFTPLYRGSTTCTTCFHDDSHHSKPHPDEEPSSNDEKGHAPHMKGTRSYIRRLQGEASAAAITEAISETREGFRPQKTKVFFVYKSRSL